MKKGFLIVPAFFLLLQTPFAWPVGSSGFENASYSAKSLGQANAVVARPQDGSTILVNPAGLIELEGIQASAGLQELDFRVFHANRATGDHNQSNRRLLPIPSFYLTANPGELLDNRVAFGLAVNSPFGLASSFPSIGVGRYTGYKNALKTAATTMSGAVRIVDNLSIGAGATHYWMYNYGQNFNYPNGNILGNTARDGLAVTDLSGAGWGWNLGLLAEPVKHHKVGVSYRSHADIQNYGKLRLEDLVSGAAQGYPVDKHYDDGISTNVGLPNNITIGYAYEPSEEWSAEFDLGITGWGIFGDQDIEFDHPTTVLRSLGTIPRDYDPTVSLHFGGHRKINEKWDLLGGFAWYEAASPKSHVDNFLPDANRYLWTLGTSYQWTDRLSIDFTYIFMLLANRRISNPTTVIKGQGNVDGQYTSIIHGPMVTVTYALDFPGEKKRAAREQPMGLDAQKAIVTG